nr:MAG TPA: hypothetical protein [Caudoviricetes sp.]
MGKRIIFDNLFECNPYSCTDICFLSNIIHIFIMYYI